MSTDAIRDAAAEMDEAGYQPAQYLVVTWDGAGVIRHYMSREVAADIMGHVADYRQALMRLNGAPGALQ